MEMSSANSAEMVTSTDQITDGLPDLVDISGGWKDEDYYEHCTGRIRGSYPWSNERACKQNEPNVQTKRWMRLSERQQKDALKAVKRLLVTPFLFQTITCPEKWLRWANKKDLMDFDLDTKCLPSGKLTREHFLTIRMMDHGLQKLYSMTEKKAKVQAIMKTMHYIQDVHSSAVDKAITETKSNENVKILVDAIQTSNKTLNKVDETFTSSMDRLYFIALLCMRQFAEVVHIMTIEARDIVLEVQHQLSDHDYYLSLDLESHREHGNELYKQKKFRDAVDAYTVAINKAPFHYLLYSNRCQALIRLQDYETALADAYRSITLKPDWGKGYHKLVTCLNEMGYLSEATEYANEGMRQCPTEENIVKNLKVMFETFEKQKKQMTAAPNPSIPDETNLATSTVNSKKKKSKTKKKKKTRSTVDTGQDKDTQSDSDRAEEDPNLPSQTVSHKNRRKESSCSQNKNDEQFQSKEKNSEKIVNQESEIMLEFEKWIQKGSNELLKNLFSEACKTYKLAIDLMENHQQIKSHNSHDFAVLLYSRGLSSQKLGYPSEIDNSRSYFVRIINEYKTFSHVSMAYYAEARSTYLLNEFSEAKNKACNALRMVKKFPMPGFLVWPGSSENIPESDERVLRSEIKLLVQQCMVPPDPTAACIYQKCSNDYRRKEIYTTDLNFEGYFEITCDWRCIVAFHLSCWPKFKHDVLTVSGDKEVLGIHCFTPDCGGVIVCIKMFDDNYDRKKCLDLPKENRSTKTTKSKSKSSTRMDKSEINMRIFKAIRQEKKRKRFYWKNPQELSNTTEAKIRKRFSVPVNDDRDVSQATIYVKNANQRRFSCRTVTPASIHKYCLSIPGYEKGLSVQLIDEIIERAKFDNFNFDVPNDVREETEVFALSFGEDVVFTDDEKLRMPFIFEYFLSFFSTNGPADVFDEVFSGQAALLPERFLHIVEKCGGLESFLHASPLFIKVSQFIGIHSQHSYMKELIEDIEKMNAASVPLIEPDQLSPFVRDFYDTGVTLKESDIANITGACNGGNNYLGHMEPIIVKASQNSETSSMYSLDDTNEIKSELNSQISVEADKSAGPTSAVAAKKSVPITIKQHHITKKQPSVKKISKMTQTEGRNDPEKAKEAIHRLQERLLEMQDESTKLKRTSQATEEALIKKNETLQEKERALRLENAALKHTAETGAARFNQLKKQLSLTETKLEQSKLNDQSKDMTLMRLTQGMQKDREAHLREIVDLRKFIESMDRDAMALKRRAAQAEIELIRTKEGYHVAIFIQAKNHCEQGAREFEAELTRISSALPEPVLHQFRLAQKIWVGNVATCENSIESLKAAYSSMVEQINAGRALSELPPVPDIKPPVLGPNPRHMMMEYQKTMKFTLPNSTSMMNGAGDGKQHNGFGLDSVMQNLTGAVSKSSSSASLPSVKKVHVHASPSPPVSLQPPIGAELPKAPKKKSFVALVEKLSKNIPQLTKEQIEICAQVVRNDNNGLTGLSYEEIERRVRQMAQLEVNVHAAQHHQRMSASFTNASASPEQSSRQYGASSSYDFAQAVGEEDEAVCPICCDPLKDSQISTLECSHKFHSECINKWMKKQRTCPNCRKYMTDTTEFPSLSRAAPPGLPGNPF